MYRIGQGFLAGAVALALTGIAVPAAAATGRVYTGIDVRAGGDGYLLSSARGQMAAFGGARAVADPVRFSGDIADVALTADGLGALVVSTRGQYYAYGTARPQPNPAGFSGDIVGVALTADGRGAMAVSSAGQFYASGTATAQPNPAGFSGRIADVALTADGRGAMAVSSAGQFYAYGTATPQLNPRGFSGRIVGVALTADGRGAMAMSSAGQFYAYGTAGAQPNPRGFSGEMTGLDLTADGRGAVAVSSTGQVYAYGTARHYGNGDSGCSTYGTTAVCQDIRARYAALGGPGGVLGSPTSGQFVAGNGRGLGQHFRNGSIYWSAATGAWDVRGLIRDRYFAFGAERGVLGFPTTGEFSALGGRARGSHFSGGSIYWSPSTGAREVHGTIHQVWAATGYENGRLGLPVTDEKVARVGRISFFAGGNIIWSGSRTTATVMPARGDLLTEALAIQKLPLTDFAALHAARGSTRTAPLNWTNDGCSGPTYGDLEKIFTDACRRHDFGSRNFGPKSANRLDVSGTSLDRVNQTFKADMYESCDRAGNPRIKNGVYWPVALPCHQFATAVYDAVYLTATGKGNPKLGAHWWR